MRYINLRFTCLLTYGFNATDLQIRTLHRPADVAEEGLLCDILWSDPDEVRRC